MKKIFFVIAAIVVSLLLHSCGNDYNDVLEIDNSIIQTRALNVDSIDKGEIIPVPESPHKRKDLSLYFINENSSFFDIRELPVNIIVRENTHNSEARYLTSNGVQSEVSMEPRNDSDNQKFKLYIMPLTGYIYIKDYQDHLLSLGVYTNAPDVRVLYIKDGTSSQGACWDFLKGEQREKSNILENADAIAQGPGGMWDVYNEVIGVKNSKIYFDKYRNSATQEFEIRLVEDLTIVSGPTYDLAGVTPEEKPSYILRGTVHNRYTTPTQMTIQYTKGANVSSSFQESNSYTTTVNANTGINTPIFSFGGSLSSSNTYGFSYTNGTVKNISYMFNQTVTVEPLSSVRVTAVVKNYHVSCDYNALVEGRSGRRFTIYGRWNGISCADVDYEIEPLDANGNAIKKIRLKGKINEPLDLTRKALNY